MWNNPFKCLPVEEIILHEGSRAEHVGIFYQKKKGNANQ